VKATQLNQVHFKSRSINTKICCGSVGSANMGRGFGVFHLIVALAAALVIAVPPVLAIEESQAQKWFSAVEKKPQADDTTQSSG
jgi:hypothetical protein